MSPRIVTSSRLGRLGPRRTLAAALSLALLLSVLTTTWRPTAARAASLTISKASYYDKTLAAIIGQVGGVVTGYEFRSPNPYPDDSCFRPTYGPYSGDAPDACWTKNNYPGYDRVGAPNFASNEVGSDDDYHVDFLDQLILSDHGPNPTYKDIKDEWTHHNVGDWGPGEIANSLMRDNGYLPPWTGQAEFDRHYWLSEPFIENDTLGLVAPGMPATARDLAGRLGSVTGEFDSVIWAKFLSTMYSMAYFQTDARTVLDQASVVLPRNSWPYSIYQKALALHGQNPTDWRWAQQQLLAFVRNVYGQDNDMVIPDRNNGSTILAILYGNNDYLTSLKIASLIGNDADCTASFIAGLMGILKGMAGTPQEFKDRIYQDGNGRYINDNTTGYPPYIKNDYPHSQSWDSIAALYQHNAETQITTNGGSTDSTNYYINAQTIDPENVVQVDNYDFEQGSLAGWTKWTPGADPGAPNAFAENNGTAQSGQWKGTVFTDADVPQVRLYTTLRGLQTGATYRVNAFVQSDQTARLYVNGYGGPEIYASAVGTYALTNRQWADRTLEFTASGSTAQVGLWMPPGNAGFSAIDNLAVAQITAPPTTRYEAETAAQSGGQTLSSSSASAGGYVGGIDNAGNYVEFTVTAPTSGEYRANINFANATTDVSTLDLIVNGNPEATIPFPRSDAWATFSRNTMQTPVVLHAGTNTIRLQRGTNAAGYAELDYLDVSAYPTPVYTPESANYLTNASFEANAATQTPTGWSTWNGTNGTDADADYTEAGGADGTYRGTQHKASAYEVFTDQTATGLPNGTYTLTAWAAGSGGQNSTFMSAKNYGSGTPELTAPIPGLGYPNWRKIVISGILVTNGQVDVGFYSNANANNWISFDDVQLRRQ